MHRVAVLESKAAAHSGYYLRYLAEAWQPSDAARELVFVLPPSFVERHPTTFSLLDSAESRAQGVSWRRVERGAWERAGREGATIGLLRHMPPLRRHLGLRVVHHARWRLLRAAVEELAPRSLLIMSLDDLLAPAVLAPPPPEVAVSGILFAPSFHYHA